MREIKFRGINPYTNEFEYWDSNSNRDDDFWSFVIPKTVGQYTGLKDKNGNEIYEGDWLRNPQGKIGRVIFADGGFKLRSIRSETTIWDFGLSFGFCANKEVVGNIHENPELLK